MGTLIPLAGNPITFVLCSQHFNKQLVDSICVFDPTAKDVEFNLNLIGNYIKGKFLFNYGLNYTNKNKTQLQEISE